MNTHLSDEKLFHLCRQYCEHARAWRQKFAGLLPEVNKRQLYAKKGFHSIFEFAAKLAGMSEEQVRLVLNLERKFEDKPMLQSLLINGEVSANKLAKIASIASSENQEILANQAHILSTRALETLTRDERISQKQTVEFENQNGSQKPLFHAESLHVNSKLQDVLSEVKSVSLVRQYEGAPVKGSLQKTVDPAAAGCFSEESHEQARPVVSLSQRCAPAHPLELLQLKLTRENLQKLLELQQKGINLNSLIAEMLDRREAEITQQKEQIAEGMGGKTVNEHAKSDNGNEWSEIKKTVTQSQKSSKPSRYIPVKIKRLITHEHGTKCSIPTCNRPSEHIHHTQRFSLIQSTAPQQAHNPHYLAPLCKEHHTIAHSIDVKFHEKRQKASLQQLRRGRR